MNRLRKSFHWIIFGGVVCYTILWYASSLFFDAQVHRIGRLIQEKGVQATLTSCHSSGYPTHLQNDLQDVKIKTKDGWILTIPVLSLRANLLFPFTRTTTLHLGGVATLVEKEKSYKAVFTNLSGTFAFVPRTIQLRVDAIDFLWRGTPIGELKDVALQIKKPLNSTIRVLVEGEAKTWFPDPMTSNLILAFHLDCVMDNWEQIWLPKTEHPPKESFFDFQKIDLQTMGTSLQGEGTLLKKPHAPWEGDLDLRLKGLAYLVGFIEAVSGMDALLNQRGSPLVGFLVGASKLLKQDDAGNLKLPLSLRNGKISLKNFPALSVTLPGFLEHTKDQDHLLPPSEK